jgi:hypothetical protein
VPSAVELWLLEALAEDTDGLDECLASGMLTSAPGGVAFRHEFARLAVEESLVLSRKVALHRRALAALSEPPIGTPDPARLAHHAEAAGEADAVLAFARRRRSWMISGSSVSRATVSFGLPCTRAYRNAAASHLDGRR